MNHYRLMAICFLLVVFILSLSSRNKETAYVDFYGKRLNEFNKSQQQLIDTVSSLTQISDEEILLLKSQIESTRLELKSIDFWLRYLEPVAYKKINGPLPVEWETEVFEKFEKPYKRKGTGLTLAELYLDEPQPQKDSLLKLLRESQDAITVFRADSIMHNLLQPDHFFLANRLFLLNLAAIYTTGFECPDTAAIIPELQSMVKDVREIYAVFNESFFPDTLSRKYLALYDSMQIFVSEESKDYSRFDHFHFISKYVNPLYALNQEFIRKYHIVSKIFNDYSLNNSNRSIFDKNLYYGQKRKGVFTSVDDTVELNEIKAVGKMLFFDPILSGNGKRSCASCHKPEQFFTDTAVATAFEFNGVNRLARNTPSLVNVVYNHLLMEDGAHISLLNQGREVITNPDEMGSTNSQVLKNVMSCDVYRKAFKKMAKLTPDHPDVSFDHVVSAIMLYYTDFSDYAAPFDRAMNGEAQISEESVKGFNLFMSKAQCATCHFVPQFNGVKPPFVSSEFEVLGVPDDAGYRKLSADSGRYKINPSTETLHAFRTGSLRNSSFTKPYMHNGVFKTMDEVIDFYNNGGGAGQGLDVSNQTLSADSLHLSMKEKEELKAFLKTLDEPIPMPGVKGQLPATTMEAFKQRKAAGDY